MQEQDYISRFQSGDFNAFWYLYEEYIDQIFAFVLRKVSERELAEDITSQVWMKAMKGLEKYNEQEWVSFKSWIYRIAQNCVIDYYRWKKENIDLDDAPELWFSFDIGKSIDDKTQLESVQKFIGHLKPIEQEIIILRVWDELSYNEISEITWKKVDNCKQIYKRTLEKIQANIVLLTVMILFL